MTLGAGIGMMNEEASQGRPPVAARIGFVHPRGCNSGGQARGSVPTANNLEGRKIPTETLNFDEEVKIRQWISPISAYSDPKTRHFPVFTVDTSRKQT